MMIAFDSEVCLSVSCGLPTHSGISSPQIDGIVKALCDCRKSMKG